MLSHVTGFRPSRDTASLSLRGLPFLGPQSGAHQLSATATVRSATFLFSFRSSDDQLLRLSFVDLVPRLGLNSIHSTTLRSSPARCSSLSASTGDREHATPLSCLQRHVVVVRLLTLASGAGVGGGHQHFLPGLISACRAPPFWRAVWQHAAFLGVGYRPGLTTRFAPLLSCGLPFLGPQSGAHRLSATAILQVGHIACFFFCFSGHSTTCCSD